MTIIWGGNLALVLNKICRVKNPMKTHRFCRHDAYQAKRIGIYYMCIDNIFN